MRPLHRLLCKARRPDLSFPWLIAAHRVQIQALADVWLADGATAFSVWVDGRPVVQWPADEVDAVPDLKAPLRVRGLVQGELRVSGVQGVLAQERLQVEADLLARLAELEDELEDMTLALVHTQDQLLDLYHLMSATQSRQNIEEMLRILTQQAARLVDVPAAFSFLQTPQRSILIQFPPATLPEADLQSLLARLQTMNCHLWMASQADAPFLPNAIENLLLVPIQVGDPIFAALGLVNKGGGFASPDLKLVYAISRQAGAQIENALLHQESVEQTKLQTEMELAKRVQMGLLAQKLPHIEGLDLFASSRPALQVGGDFYDHVFQPGRPFIFAVGDTAGKGMPAALLMSVARTVIRNAAKFMPNPMPGLLMRRSNADLYDDCTEVGLFATAFIGQYQPATRELYYANAGHSPVIYCRPGIPARLLRADGAPLGVLREIRYPSRCLVLEPGDVLIAGTDGLTEARNLQGDLYGYERLLALTTEVADASAAEIADTLFKSVGEFGAGHPQDDDQTIMVIKAIEA